MSNNNSPDDYRHKPYTKEDEYDDDDFDDSCWRDHELDLQEQQEEEDFERACNCKCGAWVVGKDGKGYHVADCYCGAE